MELHLHWDTAMGRPGLLYITTFLVLCGAGCSAQLGGLASAGTTGAPAPAGPPAPAPAPVSAQPTGTTGEASASAGIAVEVNVTFYGISLRGANDLVFVLDRSGSMSGEKIRQAKAELLGAIDGLPDGTRIGLVFFNSSTTTLSHADFVGRAASDSVRKGGGGWAGALAGGLAANVAVKAAGRDSKLVTLDAVTRPAVRKFVAGISAQGSTAAVPAMRSAYALGARHVVFLSDGLANLMGTPEDLLTEAVDRGQSGVRIDTVGLGSDQDARVLQGMADASGGTSVFF